MKISLAFLFSLFLSWSAVAQQKAKLYAYAQRISPGYRPAVADKDGNVTLKKQPDKVTYLLFLTVPKSRTVQVNKVWINGEARTFRQSPSSAPVVNPPVMKGQPEKVLVPKGEYEVIQISPGGKQEITAKDTRKPPKEPAVVEFMLNNKRCVLKLKQIEQLEDLVME